MGDKSNLDVFFGRLKDVPASVEFADTMAVIDGLYEFTPAAFRNGELLNAAGDNSGSCKLFAFAKRHNLTVQQTLACFGAYYRDDVLKHPEGDDHQNIRSFINNGWDGIGYESDPLRPRS